MFHPAIYENSRPDGIGVLEIVARQGEDQPRAGDKGETQPSFVPLKRTEVQGEIIGPFADLRLRQFFGYTQEQCPQTVEALYRFPLPGDAAVTHVVVRFGGVEIMAALQARAAAEAEYVAAKQEGRQAVLTTREAPDVFTLQVAGLQPDQEIVVETHYIQLARSEGAGWRLRIPLTTPPRYVRSDERGSGPAARPSHAQPLALLRDPGHRFGLTVQLRGVTNVTSPTHPLAVTVVNGDAQIQLQAGDLLPDRDCILQWTSQQDEQRPRLTLFSHPPPIDPRPATTDSHLYFLAQVAPPRRPPQSPLPREVILLVDHSGSMSGPKWAAADWAVERFLSDLQAQDRFALGLFHNETRWFAPQLQQGNQEQIGNAIAWLKQSSDSGGTELGVALESALRLPHTSSEAARHLLILTDAAVTDADRILRLADQEQQRAARAGQRRRISVICIDASPNAFLAQELAERGGGVAKFLTSDPNQEDITTALDEVLATWAEPLYVNLQLNLHQPQVEMSDQQTIVQHTADSTCVDLGDLAGGQPRWVVGRMPYTATASVTVDLQLADGSPLAQQTLRPAPDEPPQGRSPINLRALFGARRVQGLEYLMRAGLPPAQVAAQLVRLGYDPALVLAGQSEQPPAVYAETTRTQTVAALRALLIEEALRYGLASSETAFVATRREAGKPVQGQVVVANALPAGWSEQFLSSGPAMSRNLGGVAMAAMPMSAPKAAPTMHLTASAQKRSGLSETTPASLPQPASGAPVGQAKRHRAVIFQGQVTAGALLFFSATAPDRLPEDLTILGIALRLLSAAEDAATLDRNLALHLFVGDLASPRARIRLQDLVRQGERPLNLYRAAGQPIQLHLVDPAGWLSDHPLTVEIMLQW